MKKQMRNQSDEACMEKYFSEFTLIDSSVINPGASADSSDPLDAGIIFG